MAGLVKVILKSIRHSKTQLLYSLNNLFYLTLFADILMSDFSELFNEYGIEELKAGNNKWYLSYQAKIKIFYKITIKIVSNRRFNVPYFFLCRFFI